MQQQNVGRATQQVMVRLEAKKTHMPVGLPELLNAGGSLEDLIFSIEASASGRCFGGNVKEMMRKMLPGVLRGKFGNSIGKVIFSSKPSYRPHTERMNTNPA